VIVLLHPDEMNDHPEVLHITAQRKSQMKQQIAGASGTLQTVAGAVIPSCIFIFVYWLVSYSTRYFNQSLAMILGPGFVGALCMFVTAAAYKQFKERRKARFFISLAVCMWLALIFGYLFGDMYYFRYMAQYFTYDDMGMYVNVDPAKDNGQAFMDAGQVYFKESSYVATNRAMAFRNKRTYCVAPILRAPLLNQDGSNQLQSLSGFVPPPSGTVDFWAVGVDCCGPTGSEFTCGDVDSVISRAGMRLLREDLQPFYLLAVQEWTATIGIPATHPLFFTWVTDPIKYRDNLQDQANWTFGEMALTHFMLNIFLQVFLLVSLTKMRVV